MINSLHSIVNHWSRIDLLNVYWGSDLLHENDMQVQRVQFKGVESYSLVNGFLVTVQKWTLLYCLKVFASWFILFLSVVGVSFAVY